MSILIKMGKKHATTKSTKGTATGGGKAARVDTATHSKTDLRPAGECEGTSTEKQALKYVQALLLERYLNNLNVQRNVCANDDIKQPTSTPAEQAKMLREITQQEAEAKKVFRENMRLIENGAELSSLKPIDLQLDMKDLDDYISRQLLSADDDSVPLAIDCRVHNHQLELDLPPGIFYRHGILTTGSEAPTTQKQSVSSMMAWAADDDPDGLATVADIDALLEEDIVEINTKEASEAWKLNEAAGGEEDWITQKSPRGAKRKEPSISPRSSEDTSAIYSTKKSFPMKLPKAEQKKELCWAYDQNGWCPWEMECVFAHGRDELKGNPSETKRQFNQDQLKQLANQKFGKTSKNFQRGIIVKPTGQPNSAHGEQKACDHEKPCRVQLCPARLSFLQLKTTICKQYQAGRCIYPDCKFAHGEQELRPLPKYELCERYPKGKCSRKTSECVYAHEHAELRPKPVEIQQLEAKQKSQLGQKFSPTTVSTDVKTVSNPWIKKKSKIPANAKQSEDDDCALCLDILDDTRQMLECGHDQFHLECIGNWMRKGGKAGGSCPFCRKQSPMLTRMKEERTVDKRLSFKDALTH